jgi:hypothetical protein
MEEYKKPILRKNSEELKRLKFRINYRVAEHIEHSCTFCLNQGMYGETEYCDATEKWFATESFGICELWKRVPRIS